MYGRTFISPAHAFPGRWPFSGGGRGRGLVVPARSTEPRLQALRCLRDGQINAVQEAMQIGGQGANARPDITVIEEQEYILVGIDESRRPGGANWVNGETWQGGHGPINYCKDEPLGGQKLAHPMAGMLLDPEHPRDIWCSERYYEPNYWEKFIGPVMGDFIRRRCFECKLVCPDEAALQKHNRDVHPGKAQCVVCLNAADDVDNHLFVVSDELLVDEYREYVPGYEEYIDVNQIPVGFNFHDPFVDPFEDPVQDP